MTNEILELLREEYTIPQNGEFTLDEEKTLNLKVKNFEEEFCETLENFLYEVESRIALYEEELYTKEFADNMTLKEVFDEIEELRVL